METLRSPDGRPLRVFSGLFRIEVEGFATEFLREAAGEGKGGEAVPVGSAMILVTVASSLEDVGEDLGELVALLLTIGPVALLAAVFCGWFLARSDDRQLQASFEELDLAELAKGAVREFEEAARRKSVALYAEASVTVHLSGDRTLLAMLLRNLLDNAVRHSPEGGAVRVGVTEENETTVLTVRDEGKGIPPEVLPRIFERFFRAEEGRDRASGGTGLGLAIVKTIAEVHGAEVSAKAGPEGGTTIRVAFPRKEPFPRGGGDG